MDFMSMLREDEARQMATVEGKSWWVRERVQGEPKRNISVQGVDGRKHTLKVNDPFFVVKCATTMTGSIMELSAPDGSRKLIRWEGTFHEWTRFFAEV